MILNLFKEKKVLILGYGIEGKATESFIRTRFPDIKCGIADQSDGPDYLKKQLDYDLVIKTPGIPKRFVTKPYTTATNIFFESVSRNQIIGVTGSKGKSTTASLIAHILRSSYNDVRLVGNIGTPVLSSLELPYSTDTLFVFELSSYQLDDLKYSPHISIIVSLFPEHIPYHGSVENYYEAKRNIIGHANANDYYIYNDTFKLLQTWAKDFQGTACPYEKDLVPTNTMLIGEHNTDNIRGAITAARLFNISDKDIIRCVSAFQPLPHRLECVGEFDGIIFYDDAISTAPESTIAAIRALPNTDAIFLGGENRGFSFLKLAEELAKHHIGNIVLFPDSGKEIASAIKTIKDYSPRILKTNDMSAAVQFAYTYTKKGAVCLLSTASPSYSTWKNYKEKGSQFQTLVKYYAKKNQNTKASS